MKVTDIFKSKTAMFFVAFIILIVVGYVGQFYHFRNFTRDGEIVEAVIYNERFGTRGVPFYDYKYSIGREDYSGKAYYYYGGLKCGDTIMVIIKTKKSGKVWLCV